MSTPNNDPSQTPNSVPGSTPSEQATPNTQSTNGTPGFTQGTPDYDNFMSPNINRFTPLPNSVRSAANPTPRNRVFSYDHSSPLLYPSIRDAREAQAPRIRSDRRATLHSSMGDTVVDTPRRTFQRGDINPSYVNAQPGNTPTNPNLNPSTPRDISSQPSQAITVPSTTDASTQVIWGTTVNMQETSELFQNFLLKFKINDYLKFANLPVLDEEEVKPYYLGLLEQMFETQTYDLNLDCMHLLSDSDAKKLYYQLKLYPQELIPIMDQCLTQIFADQFQMGHQLTSPIKIRPFNLDSSSNMRDLNPNDIDQLVSVKGLMIRASQVIPDIKSAFFQCTVCDYNMMVDIHKGIIPEPTVCPRQQCQSNNSMVIVHNRCVFADKQICKLQETPDIIPDGQTPHSVSLCLYDDLVDSAKPGDRLEITGIFRSAPVRLNPRQRTIKALFRTYLDVVHIKTTSVSRVGGVSSNGDFADGLNSSQDPSLRLTQSQELEIQQLAGSTDIYERLAHSLAPSIFGMSDVKKGILLQLFGGDSKMVPDTTAQRARGDIHVLLVGDPGTSKSQMLQYAHRIAPRGMYTSGKGSSAVGLTAYITRDPDTNQLVLESGALVLSDGGMCCIDEFDKMTDGTRSILHEVMEQQTVSVAKAGIITTLNARTSILASANPINSQWHRDLSVPENINLPPSLLSRFDLVFLILDSANETEDRRLARHLVSLYLDPEARARDDTNQIPTTLLTRYIAYAKARLHPELNNEAATELVRMYVDLRKAGEATRRQESRITATTRQLESLIRLSEAHAKMRLSNVVELQDVNEAYRLLREAIKESATDPRTGLIDWDILATGHGSHSRRFLHSVKAGLVEILAQPSSAQEFQSANLFQELTRRAQDSGSLEITKRDFDVCVNELEQEGLIIITSPQDRAIRKIKRTFHQGYSLPQNRI